MWLAANPSLYTLHPTLKNRLPQSKEAYFFSQNLHVSYFFTTFVALMDIL